MKPTLLVLAAGMGSRYGGLKQLDPMGPNGETVLDYSVYDAIRAGFGKVVFIIRRDFEDAFRENIIARFEGKIETAICFQELTDLPDGFTVPEDRAKPWGTNHAIRAARQVVDTPFAVINADDFYGADSYQKASDYLTSLSTEATTPSPYGIVAFKLKNTLSENGGVNRGIATEQDGFLQDVEEIIDISIKENDTLSGLDGQGNEKTLSPEAAVSMNLWCFTPAVFPQLEKHFISFLETQLEVEKSESYIPTLVDELIKSKEATCQVIQTDSSWFGVTYPDDKPATVAAIKSLVDSGQYPSPLT